MSPFQTFVKETETILFIVKGFYSVCTPPAEKKQRITVWIQLTSVPHDCHQTINTFPHVGVPRNQIDPVYTGNIS